MTGSQPQKTDNTIVVLLCLICYFMSPNLFCRTLGTPNNDVWPEVESLPDYKNTFPKWKSGNLSSMVKNLDKNGLDLLTVRTTSKPVFLDICGSKFTVRR